MIALTIALLQLTVNGDYTGTLDGYGIAEDSALVDLVLTVRDALVIAIGR